KAVSGLPSGKGLTIGSTTAFGDVAAAAPIAGNRQTLNAATPETSPTVATDSSTAPSGFPTQSAAALDAAIVHPIATRTRLDQLTSLGWTSRVAGSLHRRHIQEHERPALAAVF